mgnify:CR=1 FL=1|jgi:hypothetical protein
MKHKKHDKIVNDFEKTKSKHLEQLATKQLKQQEKMDRLKEKQLKSDWLKFF